MVIKLLSLLFEDSWNDYLMTQTETKVLVALTNTEVLGPVNNKGLPYGFL